MNPCDELIAAFDLDSTLAGYHERLCEHLESMRYTHEPRWNWDNDWQEYKWPEWLSARIRIIKSMVGFWRTLPRLEAGFDILKVANDYEFNCQVLTRGPKWHPPAFQEKVEWCAEHVPDLHVNLVRNKERYYGKVLVDDWPEYFEKWLQVRPRGWVIAVAQPWNRDVVHPRLIKYNGKNIGDVEAVFSNVRKATLGE